MGRFHTHYLVLVVSGWLSAFLWVLSATAQQSVMEWISKGDESYGLRHDETNWPLTLLRYEKALSLSPSNFEVLWRLSRYYAFVAEREEDEDKRITLARKGYDFGKKAIQAASRRVEGHYYAGFCLGQYGRSISKVRALFEGMEGKCTSLMKRAISIDATYDSGGPLLAMGRYFHSCPWPKYDPEQAMLFYKKALKIDNTARTHVFMAETLLKEERYQEALEECDLALAVKLKPNKISYADDLWFQGKARRLKEIAKREMD